MDKYRSGALTASYIMTVVLACALVFSFFIYWLERDLEDAPEQCAEAVAETFDQFGRDPDVDEATRTELFRVCMDFYSDNPSPSKGAPADE
jgi:hypothetical protein